MDLNIFRSNERETPPEIPPDMYRSIRVMQDDLNKLENKPPVYPAQPEREEAPRSGSPFLSSETEAEPSSGDFPVATPPSTGEPDVDDIGPTEERQVVKGEPTKRIGMPKEAVVGLIVAAALGLFTAGVYLWFNLSDEPAQDPSQTAEMVTTEPTTSPEDTTEETVVATPEVPISTYQIDKPNTLVIDIEALDDAAAGIRRVLKEAEAEVSKLPAETPVEFVLVDVNRNPIAFQRYAYLAQLELSANTLRILGETFSVYLYREGDRMRYGLNISVDDPDAVQAALTRQEEYLPEAFAPVLYGGLGNAGRATFRSGSFGKLPTRFAVLDPATQTSFDYGFAGDNLVIGASQSTFRAIMTKIVVEPQAVPSSAKENI